MNFPLPPREPSRISEKSKCLAGTKPRKVVGQLFDLLIPSRILFVALRRLTASLIFVALLASTSTAEAIPCTVSCALVGLGRGHDQQMHPSDHLAERHHHHMDMNAGALPLNQEPALRSGHCATYSELVALAAASRFVLTRNTAPDSSCVMTAVVSIGATSVLYSSIHGPSVSPPNRRVSAVTPIRI
jgi:hypothetical protein